MSFFKNFGFYALNADASIMIHYGKEEGDIIMVSVYVNIFLLASKHRTLMDWIKKNLKREYNVKDLGEVKIIVDWQVTRNWDSAILKIDQSAFIRDLLEKKNLADYNSVNILIKAGSVIEMKEVDNYKETNLKAYQLLIWKLMYLSCGIRPDIAFAMGQFSKRNADPRVGHLKAVKQVLRYLKGMMHLRITYRVNKNNTPLYGLVGY